MAKRIRNCVECGSQFSYEIARGKDGKYCSDVCRRVVRSKKTAQAGRCDVAGCDGRKRAVGAKYCERHYNRLRRTGALEDPVFIGFHKQRRGYVVRHGMTGHPLAAPSHPSEVYDHRAVYYEVFGAGPFACHHCGKYLEWSNLHIDHLNDDRGDNTIGNIVPSCPGCNINRGAEKAIENRKLRQSVWIEFKGLKLTISDWARRIGIAPGSLAARIKNGWPLEKALVMAKGRTGPKPYRRTADTVSR